ncbi:MAG: hypothetical protein WBS24_11590 [Terriglobales bacterium]
MKTKKRDWKELCEAASKELDSTRLLALVSELNEALDVRAIEFSYILRGDIIIGDADIKRLN